MLANVVVPDLATATPLWLSLLATGVGALLGALLAVEAKSFDFIGLFIFAAIIGFGGGIIRDLLVGNFPPLALRSPWYLFVVLVCAIVVGVVGRYVAKSKIVLAILDAATLGLFAIIGTQAAFDKDMNALPAVFVGVAAAVGGGVIADIFMRRTPSIAMPGPPYALAAVAGAGTYGVAVGFMNINGGWAAMMAIGITFAVRIGTYLLGVQTSTITMSTPGQQRQIRAARPSPENRPPGRKGT